MAEYIEREALLDDLLDRDCECADKSKQDIGNWLLHEYVYDLVKRRPTADVVEVVRCQDCDLSAYPEAKIVWCKRHNKYMPVNGYCNYGERKGDGQ